MKQTLHRLFCLLLCAVMVVGMVPATASAAQNSKQPAEYEEASVTTEIDAVKVSVGKNGTYGYTPTTILKEQSVIVPKEEKAAVKNSFPAKNTIVPSEWGYYTFETFEDLKELAAGTYEDWTSAIYEGTGDLVISESLTLPRYLDLSVENGEDLVISAGATLSTGTNGSIYVSNDLIVKGTLVLDGSSHCYGDVTVTGSILVGSIFTLNPDADIIGMENIQLVNEWSNIKYRIDSDSLSELREAIAIAKANPNNLYELYLYPDEDVVLTSDLFFPENATFDSWSSGYTITVNAGVTLTFNNDTWISNPMVIKGKLVNNDRLWYYGNDNENAIQFTSTGSYSGKGYLLVMVNDSDADYTPYVTGLDTTNLEIIQLDDRWQIRDLSSMIRLSAPTNLTWNKAERWFYSEDTESWYSKVQTYYGAIRFKSGAVLDEGLEYTAYETKLYRDEELYYTTVLVFNNDELSAGGYVYDYLQNRVDFETGEYYFTVQALAQSTGYADSPIAVSPTWNYTKPSERYARPTNAVWKNGPRITWDRPIEDYYFSKVEVFYKRNASDTPTSIFWQWGEDMIAFEIDPWIFDSFGPGYYYFKVRTLSDNINKKFHSAWTSMSKAYHYTGENKPMAPTLKSSIDASSGKPSLTWERSPGANKYRVYRSTSSTGTYKSIGVVESDIIEWDYSFIDTTAKAGTKYYYKVRAYSYTGVTSSLSNAVSRMCDLARPTVSITGSASTGKPIVKWETVEGASKYYIYRATSKTGTYKHVKTAISARSYEDTDAKAGTNYYYKVKAVHSNTDANSAYSKIINRMCDLKRPVVTITHSTAGNPYLKWSAIDGAEKYYIYRATSKTGTYKYLASTTSAKYVDKDVTEGKTYYYKVKAIHAKESANSAYSAIDYITAK